jgi:hypothetical protein
LSTLDPEYWQPSSAVRPLAYDPEKANQFSTKLGSGLID